VLISDFDELVKEGVEKRFWTDVIQFFFTNYEIERDDKGNPVDFINVNNFTPGSMRKHFPEVAFDTSQLINDDECESFIKFLNDKNIDGITKWIQEISEYFTKVGGRPKGREGKDVPDLISCLIEHHNMKRPNGKKLVEILGMIKYCLYKADGYVQNKNILDLSKEWALKTNHVSIKRVLDCLERHQILKKDGRGYRLNKSL